MIAAARKRASLSVALITAVLLAGCVERPEAIPVAETSTTTTEPAAEEVELRAESVERRAKEVTVRVRNRTCIGVATGSGTIIGPRTLVTNSHVVAGALELGVSTWDGRSVTVDVARSTTVADLAIVALAEPLAETVTIREGHVGADEELQAVGYPGGGELTFTSGTAVDYQVNRSLGTTEAILRFTAPVRPGNSGGPVLDAAGELVGVVFAEEISTGYALAVPADVLSETMAEGGFDEAVVSCRD